MDTVIFVSVITILGGILALGGKRLADELRGLDLRSVTGALVALAVVSRYCLFLLLAYPLMLGAHYMQWREPPNPTEAWFSHVLALQFENNQFPVINGADDQTFITVSEISGAVHFGQLPGMAYFILIVVMAVTMFCAFRFLRHAETVLRSLYNRTPFVTGNDVLCKQLALYGIAISVTIYIGKIVLGVYLSQSFTIEGVQLSAQGISLLRPIVVAGVLFVMSEVFRIGRELKEENELTV